jgi:hypothetical protein
MTLAPAQFAKQSKNPSAGEGNDKAETAGAADNMSRAFCWNFLG